MVSSTRRHSSTITVNLASLDARVADIIAPPNTTSSSEKESDVRTKGGKQPICQCGNKIKVFVNENNEIVGYGHKDKKHWVDKPHKAKPVAA